LRLSRPGMVQTFSQYEFIFVFLKHCLDRRVLIDLPEWPGSVTVPLQWPRTPAAPPARTHDQLAVPSLLAAKHQTCSAAYTRNSATCAAGARPRIVWPWALSHPFP
jgi:hypothetical protein